MPSSRMIDIHTELTNPYKQTVTGIDFTLLKSTYENQELTYESYFEKLDILFYCQQFICLVTVSPWQRPSHPSGPFTTGKIQRR